MRKLILSIASILLIGGAVYARYTSLSGSGSGSASWPVSGTPSTFTPDGTSSTTWSGSNTFNNTVNFSSGLFATSLDNVVMRAYGLSGSGYGYWDISSPNSSGGAAIRMYTNGGLKAEFGYSGNSSPAARWGSFWLTNYPGGGSTITVSAINGFVGINQATPRMQLDVTGGIIATASGTFASLSVQGGGSSVLDTGTQSVRTDLINGTTYTYTASSADFTNVSLVSWTTDYIPAMQKLVQVWTSTQLANVSSGTFNTGTIGNVMWDGQLSTRSQEAVWSAWLPAGDSTLDPSLVFAEAFSTGAHPEDITFSLAVASASLGTKGTSFDELVWNSTYVVICTTVNAVGSDQHLMTTASSLVSWKTIFGSGNKTVYFRFINTKSANASMRWVNNVVLAWRRKT